MSTHRLLQTRKVSLHDRRYISISHSRRRALELAMLRKDLVRNRSGNAPPPRYSSDHALVIGPEEGEQEADRERFNVILLDVVKQSFDFGRVDRVKHLSAVVE